MPNALKDKNIKGIICNISGEDTIRFLQYIDFDIIKSNPKFFMGYSDTTVNHFMMYKAGVASYYGPSVMCEFAEIYEMHDYTKKYVDKVLFRNLENIIITSSPKWASEFLDWSNETYNSQKRKNHYEKHGYEIWPSINEWKNKVLFLETSEDEEPQNEKYYEEYKEVYKNVIDGEVNRPELPIFTMLI